MVVNRHNISHVVECSTYYYEVYPLFRHLIDEECYSILYHGIISMVAAEYCSLDVMGWKSGRRILTPVFIRHLVPSIDVVRTPYDNDD